MADTQFHKMSKSTWYKWSLYINVILFLIIAVSIYFLVIDCLMYDAGSSAYPWFKIVRDLAFLIVSLSLVFFQFFRNLLIIMRRNW